MATWTPTNHTLFTGPLAAIAALAANYHPRAALRAGYISTEAVRALARADEPLLVMLDDDCDISPAAAEVIRELPPGPLVFIASEPIDGLTDGWDQIWTQDVADASGRPWGVLTPADGSPSVRVSIGGL